MKEFSEQTLGILHNAGWSKNYSVDVEQYKKLFNDLCQSYSDVVMDFLGSFGGIQVKTANHKYAMAFDGFYIDPLAMVEEPEPHLFDFEDRLIGKPTCIIGFNYNYNGMLFMAQDGAVYSVFLPREVYYVARTGIEAIEIICTRQQFHGNTMP